ncbi:MAG: alpha-L-rhamnosidase-related protein [Saccharofermentanales bacterium]
MANPKSIQNSYWSKETSGKNRYIQFLDSFLVDESDPVAFASLAIRADSQYAVWINGQLAGFGQYADYESSPVYDSYDVSEKIIPGVNSVAILGYSYGEDCQVYRMGTPGICCRIEGSDGLLFELSDKTLCRISPSYESGEIERISPQLSFSFRYHADLEDGWFKAGFVPDRDIWDSAVFQKQYILLPRPVEKLEILPRHPITLGAQGIFRADPLAASSGERMQQAFLSALPLASLTNIQTGSYDLVRHAQDGIHFSHSGSDADGIYLIIDLSEEEAGYLDLDIAVPRGTRVDIGFGEHLEDLRVRAYTKDGPRNFAATFYGSGNRDRFTYWIKRLGCRYLQLHIYAHEFDFYYAGLLPALYPLDTANLLTLPDSLDQRIYDVGIRTLRLCMHEHYEDCPWREQALYAMDSRSQMLCGYHAFGEFVFARESIRLLGLGQRANGILELCAPAGVPVTIPSFSLIWIIQLQEYVSISGDMQFGEEMFPVLSRILDYFRSRKQDDLLFAPQEDGIWNFYDWADGLEGHHSADSAESGIRLDAPLSAFYSLALRSAGILAGQIGRESQTDAFEAERSDINLAAKAAFWDDSAGCYTTYLRNGNRYHRCQLTQALMICAGITEGEQATALADYMISKDSGLVEATLSYKIFLYDALLAVSGSHSSWIMRNIREIWGKMLFQGATSFWETKEGASAFNCAGSLCHGWSAIPVYYYHTLQ